ncbi:hypothetical protein [Maribellus sp. YY47]|uniref:hypothetical protein n=1 Tax=Maribellus sp. YY47 TaxID=2929486 RepID=UPI0020006CB4|nr:hypothetical protein [Maribellus sp. YY47]MCK3686163.1 hypothetical protein [Maribellus sp. YY47]
MIDWEWYTEPNTFRVFTHLLLQANFEPQKWKGIDLLPGQLIIGRKQLADELKLSERQIRTSLNRLKSTNELTIKTTNRFSIVTICKWSQYQGEREPERPTERPAYGQSSDQQTTTAKEYKNKRKNIEERKRDFANSLNPFFDMYGKEMMNNFYSYWTEHGENDRKMRFEKQSSFGISRRLATWKKNQKTNSYTTLPPLRGVEK